MYGITLIKFSSFYDLKYLITCAKIHFLMYFQCIRAFLAIEIPLKNTRDFAIFGKKFSVKKKDFPVRAVSYIGSSLDGRGTIVGQLRITSRNPTKVNAPLARPISEISRWFRVTWTRTRDFVSGLRRLSRIIRRIRAASERYLRKAHRRLKSRAFHNAFDDTPVVRLRYRLNSKCIDGFSRHLCVNHLDVCNVAPIHTQTIDMKDILVFRDPHSSRTVGLPRRRDDARKARGEIEGSPMPFRRRAAKNTKCANVSFLRAGDTRWYRYETSSIMQVDLCERFMPSLRGVQINKSVSRARVGRGFNKITLRSRCVKLYQIVGSHACISHFWGLYNSLCYWFRDPYRPCDFSFLDASQFLILNRGI